ncbi:DUF4331 domain-containing protein [Saccharopolyspora indica]|uniref:DUF4331 family protein n=1 Tax=Saccharopolyspora indica TaxID=1229659 RepID=UPI0022EB1C1C|nr:DUF4331 family protein [Saccharopolyspora indica]MDA3647901.1 DUF4331 family protein [Saccharopolyspora indica]
MSHHLDSPLARQDPRLDISDVYLFRGTGGTAFVINVNPLSGAGAFHPEGVYEFKVDTDDDAIEDITFRVTFGEQDADGRQPLELRRLDGADARDRDAAGVLVLSGTTGAEISGTGGTRIWAGPAADPFYIEPTVITAVKNAVAGGGTIDLGDWDSSEAANLFAGTNVSAIVLEVPNDAFGADTIGFWGVTVLPTDAGGWRQINRCAQPLINTIFHPDDSDRASQYNTTQPSQDQEIYGPAVRELVARVVAELRTAADPADYARQVSETIFPDLLRYEIGTPANFGFAKRNGRGLTECGPEVMFGVVLNKAVPLGLDSRAASGRLRDEFPYLSLPVQATEPA